MYIVHYMQPFDPATLLCRIENFGLRTIHAQDSVNLSKWALSPRQVSPII